MIGSRPLFDRYPFTFLYSAVFTLTYHLMQLDANERKTEAPVQDIIRTTTAKYQRLVQFLRDHDLAAVHRERPLLDGNRILMHFSALLGYTDKKPLKTGPWMMRLMGEQMAWQLEQGHYGQRLAQLDPMQREQVEQLLFKHLEAIVQRDHLLE